MKNILRSSAIFCLLLGLALPALQASSLTAQAMPNPVLYPRAYLPLVAKPGLNPVTSGILLDHTTTDISKIPSSYIEQAKNIVKVSYGHTSHGSQLVTGMSLWKQANPLYSYRSDGAVQVGVLSLADTTPGGDVGYSGWDNLTRNYLNGSGNDRNVVMWSWCGQLEGYTEGQVQDYLSRMNQLEQQYPGVNFVYMTQHTIWQEDPWQNDRIREYALANGKILFDFADMEKYTPDGDPVPMDQVSDSCPWCANYCSEHPDYCADLYKISGQCAHTHELLCKIKGQAFWWLMARLVGWQP